jgi:hypothetical protein
MLDGDLINMDQLQHIISVDVEIGDNNCQYTLKLQFVGQTQPVIWHYLMPADRDQAIHHLMCGMSNVHVSK